MKFKPLILLFLFIVACPVQAGDGMGVIEIPSIGVSATIIEANSYYNGSWDLRHLGSRVAHLGGTGWIDQGSNIVLAGHVDRVFMDLHLLQQGDEIVIIVDGAEYHYVVSAVFKTNINDMSVIYPSDHEKLTLITCADYNKRTKAWDTRLIVIADRVSP